MAHIRQSRPDSGLGFQVKPIKTFQNVPSSLGRRRHRLPRTISPTRARDTSKNVAHIRQSRPDSGLGFQAKVLKMFQVAPSSLGRRRRRLTRALSPPPGVYGSGFRIQGLGFRF